MNKKNILIVFGTRPEVIKFASTIRVLADENNLNTRVVITAQHRQMIDQALNVFDIEPFYDLDIMKDNQDLFDITSNALIGLKEVVQDFEPDYVLVQGDTTTTFTGALAAFYKKIPVAHIEAGLRTHNKYSPFPEEVNRKIVSSIADIHFPPTNLSKDNLIREGVSDNDVVVTGNTAIDSLLWVIENKQSDFDDTIKNALKKKIILLTTHRRESFGEPMREVLTAVAEIANAHPELNIVFPVHLNPNVRKEVDDILGDVTNVIRVEPMDYINFAHLMNNAEIILTDSGGVQEEAPSLGKPLLVLRNTTERPEGIEAGVACLVGTDKEKIISLTEKLLTDRNFYEKMSKAVNPYGDGKSARRIVDEIKKRLSVE